MLITVLCHHTGVVEARHVLREPKAPLLVHYNREVASLVLEERIPEIALHSVIDIRLDMQTEFFDDV